MKKYVIYLDESGDFDTDLEPGSRKNASLVGGFFWDRDDGLDVNALKNWIKVVMGGENHATEIDRDKKGLLVCELLTSAKEFPIEFVIFQNDVKKKIVNSTQTYLTVVTEGLVQLMKSLVIVENGPVELEVIAGFRKDTTKPVTNSYVEGYIPLADYRERLIEKLAVEKAKLKSDSVQRSMIHVSLSDDKRDTLLVLCDYICNFWYTRQARVFSELVEKNGEPQKVRDILKPLYRPEYVFPLFNTEENEHVLRMVQGGFYADALFEACAGMLTEMNADMVKQSFIKLRHKQIHRQLSNLADYIGDLLIFGAPERLTWQVLKAAEDLYALLADNGIEDLRFHIDIKMYMLAYLNNTNRLGEMEEIFNLIEKDVARYTIQTLNIEYLLIYYTRRAVFLQDCQRYEESCKVCDEMEFLLSMVEDAIRNSDFLHSESEIRSERLGKILGTKLQAMVFLCYSDRAKYESAARELSDRAIRQFEYPHDLARQYQYRAELEAVCGQQSEALGWLERSFGNVGWKEYLSNQKKGIYDLYNLLFVAALTKRQGRAVSVEIADLIYKTCKNELFEDAAIGKRCLFLMGYTLCEDVRLDGRGKALLNRLIQSAEEKDRVVANAARAVLAGEDGMQVFFEAVG